MALINDPTDPEFNTYTSLDQADAYYESVSPEIAEIWADLDQATKERALRRATQLIDQKIRFQGHKTSPDQPLEWPRKHVLIDGSWTPDHHVFGYQVNNFIPSDQIPNFLICATAALARGVVANADGADPLISFRNNFTEVKVGPIDLTTRERIDEDLFTGEVLGWLRKHGDFIALPDRNFQKTGGFTIGRVVRGH